MRPGGVRRLALRCDAIILEGDQRLVPLGIKAAPASETDRKSVTPRTGEFSAKAGTDRMCSADSIDKENRYDKKTLDLFSRPGGDEFNMCDYALARWRSEPDHW